MRVKFDDQIFVSQVRGGISSYFAWLVREFRSNACYNVEVTGLPVFSKTSGAHDALGSRPFPINILNRPRILSFANGLARSPRLRPDLVHSTYYNSRHLAKGHKRVMTVHDMSPEILPDKFALGDAHKYKAQQVTEADAILCVSETTKNDLLSYFPKISAPIFVTPLAVGDPFLGELPTVTSMLETPRTFVLFVGARFSYKGFDVFLKAFALLREDLDVGLVLVGGNPLDNLERQQIRALNLGKNFLHCSPTDADLATIYRRATVFVYPSFYEGFGLPILEALACSCPIVISNAPALLEVAGDAARVFPRGDERALAAEMLSVVDHAERTQVLQALGLNRVAEFSWQKTAELTRNAYQQVLG
ncbi:glycosyltransferase family 1 protein [Cryobacterium sp. PH31-O1]|uniref:glycosyltransferase family 4 protein n=1 Tax=Cryobacterium sp. PH31-O1 TaxID=3046306 RepID=UPI0024B9ABA2|nr:glycosyltransferase family 1 protein [Cryobacterium sp. PH31-O1]MDJ0338359.1 glycosyltransferase family 1 protein [Cryobacterium sp. PH31-O1]